MESYDALKNRLQDLKPFPTFKMVTTILQKILQNGFYDARSIERNQASIEGSFQ